MIRDSFANLTGLDLSDRQWSQAGRSFRTAGLGLRSSERHAACAYIASRAATHEKCIEIDPRFSWDVEVPGSDAARAYASLLASLPPDSDLAPTDSRLRSQKTLSRLLDEADLEAQRASADTAERANLNSETLPGASGFLSATPSKVLGLAMSAAEFVEELKVRLWVPTHS